ncbi:MAG: hypothetical protein E7479_02200 [Ruminococcaceae bacterium]|nr:hypothetical protein [Oscillospiraceae bacterium]
MPDNYDLYENIRRKTSDEYDRMVSSLGISKGEMMIIWSLFDFGRPCTQKEICLDWLVNKQTINSAAKKLAEEGIIDITPSPENMREKFLVFTEKGKFLAMRTAQKLVEAERKAFFRLSEEEQAESIRISQKHYEILKEEFAKIKGENK